MKHHISPTWIVVMDSSVARFYALHRDADGTLRIDAAADAMTSDLHRHAQDLKSDAPGRGFRSATSSAHHGLEPKHDYHKLEKHDFVRSVSDVLKTAHDAHAFERLVLVAPERSLGELRSVLAKPVGECVWREIGKDLVKLTDQELWARIEPDLHEHLESEA